jgi:hypothetical protein
MWLAQNRKMMGTQIVMCPEIERADPCIYFGKGFCPNCYAERLWFLRKQSWKGRTKTPAKGLIRLGTWREILPQDYERFKSLFPYRYFFLITRGLLPMWFYEKINSDQFCVNLQVSVDIVNNKVIPTEEKLLKFSKLSKILYRFKTLPSNVDAFVELSQKLGIPSCRILETPLRLPYGQKLYDPTPMSKRLAKNSFLRCNTECIDCTKENGTLVCAINPEKFNSLVNLPQTETDCIFTTKKF